MVAKTTQSRTTYFFSHFFLGHPITINFYVDNLSTIEQLLRQKSIRSPFRVGCGGQPKLNFIFGANVFQARLYSTEKHFFSNKTSSSKTYVFPFHILSLSELIAQNFQNQIFNSFSKLDNFRFRDSVDYKICNMCTSVNYRRGRDIFYRRF